MKIKNLRIQTRLLAGFGIIIFMVIVLGVLAFFQSRSIWQNSRDLYEHPFAVNLAVREIETDIVMMHRSLKDLVLSESKADFQKYNNDINESEADVYKKFDIVYSRYLGNRSTIDSAYEAFKWWKEVRDSTIMLCEQEKYKEAAYRTTHAGEEYVNIILIDRISKLKSFAMNKATTFYSSAENIKNNLRVQLFLVIGFILMLTLVIVVVILKGINTPIRELIAVTIRHQQGDYSARSVNDSTNEIGMLARSVNRMAESIQADINLKAGVLDISEAIIGKEDLLYFGKSLIEVLLSKTNSNIGAIYFLNEENLMFEPYFSVGLLSDRIKSFSATKHEGEFGRALLEKKIIRISEIPGDSVFDFATVAGNFKPKEILNIPILLQDKPIAMISLASLYPYSDKTIELLKFSEKNLTTGINGILAFDKIREYSQKLNEQNSELEAQSEEMKLQTDELLEQNAELDMQKRQIDESNRLKSEFLSSMSHELRTPLNSVIALTNVLHKRLLKKIPEEEYNYLEVIERNGKNLLSLINDILDLSRIEAGKTEIQISTFSVKEIVESVFSTLQIQIKDKNILTSIEIDENFPMITSDMSKCHHILQNIIANAVKFTDEGSVDVSGKLVGEEVHISIKDTGIGIPGDQLPHIFEEFRQVDGTASRKHEGTGLGLAIAHKYSRLINARIKVSSRLGEGSIFTFIIPVVPPEDLSSDIIEDATQTPYAMPGLLSGIKHGGGAGKTILIIEDSEPAIIQLTEILKEQGYLLKIARSGPEAFEVVKAGKPDAVILDLMMPGMDGFEVLEKIRADKTISKIPVLILTAKYLSKSELKQLTENNIHQLIQKGDIGKSALLNSIGRMFVKVEPDNRKKEGIAKRPASRNGKSVILLVEDNKDNVLAIRALIGERYEVIVAIDGPEGVAKAKSVVPDLILLDISLPLLDGFKVLDEIKKDEALLHIPIIAVTASVMKGNREEMLEYGFDDYIAKPIDSIIFEEKLNKFLK